MFRQQDLWSDKKDLCSNNKTGDTYKEAEINIVYKVYNI